MSTTTDLMMDFSSLEAGIISKLQESIGGIITVIILIIILWILWYMLQPEMKGECPYCGRTFLLRKRHQDKMCQHCNKEFRLRGMRVYKGEDVVDEFLYYMTRAFACLAVLSGDLTERQKRYVEECGKKQELTRHQFKDMLSTYDKEIKTSMGLRNNYKKMIYKLRLYVEDYFSDRKMFDMENNENNILSSLYNFAIIDGKITENENLFFNYFKKVFIIDDDRFNLVVTNMYIPEGDKHNSKSDTYSRTDENINSSEDYYESDNQRDTQTYSTKNQEYYKILGCDSDVSDEELKKQYKKMMMQYHPDKYASSSLPEEIEKMLNEKMSELNEAYDKIKQERGMN